MFSAHLQRIIAGASLLTFGDKERERWEELIQAALAISFSLQTGNIQAETVILSKIQQTVALSKTSEKHSNSLVYEKKSAYVNNIMSNHDSVCGVASLMMLTLFCFRQTVLNQRLQSRS
jgi:hypothetical protein